MSHTAKFCDQCGAAAAAAEMDKPAFRDRTTASLVTPVEPAAAARKTITVLFCDLVGSTGFGEAVDAEAVREAIGRYHAMAQATVDAHAGTVAKFIGDGVMAVFGIPEIGEDDADRAVATGLALQAGFSPIRQHIIDRYGFDVGLRVGINTGEVVIDVQDADIVGDALNTAARLEAACTPGRVLVGLETWRLTRSTVRYEVLGEVTIRGKSDPVETFQVVDDTPHEDAAAPFVSREAELGELRAVYHRAVADRTAHIATVIGAPGIGKTRIAGELARACAEALHIDLRCERSGSATFAPIIELLRVTCGIDSDQVAADALAAIGVVVGESEVDRARVIDLLGSFVGATTARSTEETFFAVRRLLEVLGASRPVLLVVDDVQWAEPLFLDLLDHLVEWVSDAPVLIVALARPEIRELRAALTEQGRRISAVLSLEGLDASATEELAARLLGAESLPSEMTALLPESTEGNPLFVRELVRMLVDDGVVARTANGWEMTVDAEAVAVPPTIQSLLAARVERMPAADRQFVELASVVGSEFPRGAVGAIAEAADESEIEATIERLRRRDIIEPTGSYWGNEPIYRFHHVLIRDAAYRRILKRSRADLHVRVGEWTEHTAAELVGEYEASIAFHYEQAHQCRSEVGLLDDETTAVGARAATLLQTAAKRALERDDLSAAGSLALRALARLGSDAPSRRELLLVACESLFGAGNVAEGQIVLDELDELTADPRLEAWSACFHGQLINLSLPDELSFAEASVGAAAERLAEFHDHAGVAKARQTRAGTLARLGRVGECEAELDLALTAARAAADGRRVTAVLGSAPVAALWGPSPVPRAGGRCLDVIRLLRITTGSPAVEATAVRCQAVLEALRGRFDTARTMLTAARRTAEELGLRHGLMETELYTGIVELLADRPADAEPHLRAAYAGLGALGIGADAGQAGAHLARALLLQGRIDEAEELADSSDSLAGQNPQTLVAVRSVQAEIQAARGSFGEAITLAQEAVARVATSDLIVDHAQANLSLARVLAAAGDEAGKASALAKASHLFDLKGAVVEFQYPPGAVRHEDFDELEVTRALDRFEEVIDAQRSFPGGLTNRCAAAVERACAMFEARDSDRYLDCFSDPMHSHHGHFLSGPGEATTREELLADFRSREAVGFDHMEFTTLAVRNDDLCLGRLVYRNAEGQESTTLRVVGLDAGGRITTMASFDAEELRAAVDELDRLYMDQLEPILRAAYGSFIEFDQLVGAGELDRAAENFLPDARIVDHRNLGWGPESTIQERLQSLADVSSNMLLFTTAVHSIGWDWLCTSRRYVIAMPDGAVTEQDLVLINDLDPERGRVRRIDQYGEDQLTDALDDLAERLASPTRRLVPSNRANWTDVWIGFAIQTGRSLPDTQLLRPDGVRVRRDDEDQLIAVEDIADDPSARRLVGYDAQDRWLIAVRGDRLALLAKRYSDREPELFLVELDESRRLSGVRAFEVSDLGAALDELDGRHFELAGSDRSGSDRSGSDRAAAAAVCAAYTSALRAHDAAALHQVLANDFAGRDHGAPGRPSMDRATMIERQHAVGADHGVALSRIVHAADDNAVVASLSWLSGDSPADWIENDAAVALIQTGGGQVRVLDVYAKHQLDTALARFGELSEAAVSALSRRLENLATRVGNRRMALILSGDLDALDDLTAAGFVQDDRRTLMHTLAAAPDLHPVVVRLVTEATSAIRAETLATRGELLALVRVGFEVDGFEVDFLAIEALDEHHRQARTVLFDIDALGPAFDELNQLFLDGEGAPSAAHLSIWFSMMSALNRGDADTFARAVPDRIRIIDHRPMGWPTMDREQFIEFITVPEALGRGVTGIREIHRLNELGAVATGFNFVDGADGMAQPGWEYVVLTTADADDMVVAEYFASDDLETALARFDGERLDDHQPEATPPDVVASEDVTTRMGDAVDEALVRFDELARSVDAAEHEPWNAADRLTRQFIERFDDQSSGDWLEMLDPQIVAEDRQPILGSTLIGREAHRTAWTRDIGDRQLLSTVETIAVRGDRLALHRWRLSVDDGGLTWDLLRVSHWNDRDLADHSIGFTADDLQAAIAELDQLFLEESATSHVGDAFRVFSLAAATLAAGDIDGYLAFLGPSTVMVDHRRLGWPELNRGTLRPRLESIVNMPGEVSFLLERYLRIDPTWAACWVQSIVFDLPHGVEQVQRSVMAMMIDPDGGQWSRTEQFEEDHIVDALARLDEMIVERGDVLVNRAWMCWLVAHGLRQAGRPDLIVDSFGSDAAYIDQRAGVLEPVVVEHRRLLAVRSELLALVEIRGRGADGEAIHSFAVEEIDEHGRLRPMTMFPADKAGLTDAANLLAQRWEIEAESAVLNAVGAWERAHRASDVDGMLAASHPDLVLVDHRPLGWPTLDQRAVVSMVGERPDVEHGVLLAERIIAVKGRGLVGRSRQWQFGPDDQMTMLIPSYCVVTVRDGVVDRFEFFPDDDPAPAIARLHELT